MIKYYTLGISNPEIIIVEVKMKLQDDIEKMNRLLEELDKRKHKIRNVFQISSIDTNLRLLETVLKNEEINSQSIKNPIKRILVRNNLKQCDADLQILRQKYLNLVEAIEKMAP